MSWYDEMVVAGRSKSLTTGNIRRGVAAVYEVLGSPALETPVNCHSELMEDPLMCVCVCRQDLSVMERPTLMETSNCYYVNYEMQGAGMLSSELFL